MTELAGIDGDKRRRLLAGESDRFRRDHAGSIDWVRGSEGVLPAGVPMSWMHELYKHPPIVVEGAEGSSFTDIDGNRYRDFNLGDMSVLAGWAHPVVLRAAAERLAKGGQFLMPTDEARGLATELAGRLGRPKWRFTLSATQANVEILRICRVATGRNGVLMFGGKYHGHAEELLLGGDEGLFPEARGISAERSGPVRIAPFNDLEAVERALAGGDIACVLTEPALTNVGVVLPDSGFHEGLREACDRAGAYLIYDETHTLAAGPNGLTGLWNLRPDAVTLGKGIAGGLPIGAYGMSDELASIAIGEKGTEEVASGGTLYGYALGMAVALAFVTEVLTEAAHDRAAELGAELADGIEAAATGRGLDWRAHRLRNRSGVTHAAELPRNSTEASETFDAELFELQRLYMANRGIWEAISSAGPAVSLVAGPDDVGAYLDTFDSFLGELT